MAMFKNVDELNNYLNGLRKDDYQNDNFISFLKKIKFQYQIPSIHVAGTAGKGCVCKLLDEIYVNHHYRVGCFLNDEYPSILDMITIDNKPISCGDFSKIVDKYQKEISKFHLSKYEVTAFVAFHYFNEHHCDIGIIECGMGGEIDATNIFDPILALIVSIGLEHTNYLGSSISEIAWQIAGIIKDKTPVIVGDLNDEALDAIVDYCKDSKSIILKSDFFLNEKIIDNEYVFDFKPYRNLKVSSSAYYLLKDIAIALSAIHFLKDFYPIAEDNIKNALSNFNLLGRMTIICNNPLLILDGAHNPTSISSLRESIEKINDNDLPIHTIFASYKDKNIDAMLAELSFISKDITLTTFNQNGARKQEEYFLYLQEYNFKEDAIQLIKDKMLEFPNDIILVTGSLAFVKYCIDKLNDK